jgi:hypothetical protein
MLLLYGKALSCLLPTSLSPFPSRVLEAPLHTRLCLALELLQSQDKLFTIALDCAHKGRGCVFGKQCHQTSLL